MRRVVLAVVPVLAFACSLDPEFVDQCDETAGYGDGPPQEFHGDGYPGTGEIDVMCGPRRGFYLSVSP